MQKSLFIISILLIILIFSYPETITGKINGSPGGKTNSPLDGSNCTSCHAGTINSGPGNINITSDVPVNGYTPGETYTITTSMSEIGPFINAFLWKIKGTLLQNYLHQWYLVPDM